MAILRNSRDDLHKIVKLCAAPIDGEKDRIQSPFACIAGRLHGKRNRLFQCPAIRAFNEAAAGRNFDDNALRTAVGNLVDICLHAARKGKDLRPEITFDDVCDGLCIRRRNGGHARLNPMDPPLGKPFRNGDLVVMREDKPGLLFAVAERHVMQLDLLRKIQLLSDLLRIVPRTVQPEGFSAHG